MILRPATPADAEALAALGRDSFCASFAHLYSADDLNAFLQQCYSVEAVTQEIADPALLHCLVQDAADSSLAAYCKVQHPSGYAEYSDAKNPIALNQLYTDPARTGEGLGARLMDWTIDLAKKRDCDAIQLSVWSENFGAQRFYQRYGFGKIADIHFMVGQHRDEELLYELRL